MHNLKLYLARGSENLRTARKARAEGAERTCKGTGQAMVWRRYGEKHCRRNTAVVPFPDLTCGIVPRMVLRSCSPCLPSRRRPPKLLWLMHFARVLGPICMHHARKSGTKLNCRYIVHQDAGPGDTNKSPWKSCRRNRRTFAERLNSLESAPRPRPLPFILYARYPRRFSDFSTVRIRVRSVNRLGARLKSFTRQ